MQMNLKEIKRELEIADAGIKSLTNKKDSLSHLKDELVKMPRLDAQNKTVLFIAIDIICKELGATNTVNKDKFRPTFSKFYENTISRIDAALKNLDGHVKLLNMLLQEKNLSALNRKLTLVSKRVEWIHPSLHEVNEATDVFLRVMSDSGIPQDDFRITNKKVKNPLLYKTKLVESVEATRTRIKNELKTLKINIKEFKE